MVRFEVMAFEKPAVSGSTPTVRSDQNAGIKANISGEFAYQAPSPLKPGERNS